MSDLAAALMVAIRIHAGQVDKQGEPYLLHVLRVVEAVSGEAKVVAALHDVFEDSALTPELLWREMPMSSREVTDLSILRRGSVPGQTYAQYIGFIADCSPGSLAREVKLADLRDNLGRIPPEPRGPFAIEEARTEVWEDWSRVWGSLKARYEKAIETLEAA